MEITTDDSTDKDKDMKDTFKEYAEIKTPKEEKKKAPLSLEALLNPDKQQENDKKSSLFEILGGIDVEPEKPEEPEPTVAEKDISKEEVETQVPLEELSETEKTEVTQDYITTTSEEVTNEIAHVAPDSVEEAEAVASQAFLEELQNKINNNKEIDEDVIEDAGNQALELLDIEVEDTETEEVGSNETELVIDEAEEQPEDSVNEDEDSARTQSAQPIPVAPTAPQTPVVTNVSPPIPASTVPPKLDSDLEGSRDNVAQNRLDAKDTMVESVVEDMMEKRKEAVESEDQLQPIQEKLEKQVGDLHETLTAQDLKIRKLAALQFEQSQLRSSEQFEQTSDDQAYHSSVEIDSPEIEKKFSAESVEIMTFPDILTIAEAIIIGGLSLRNLYEQGHFDQDQLRELVKEHLDGESVEKMYPELFAGQELLNEQATEKLRDDGPVNGVANQAAESKVLLDLGSRSLTASEVDLSTESVSGPTASMHNTPKAKSNKNPTILLVVLAAVATGVAVILVVTLI